MFIYRRLLGRERREYADHLSRLSPADRRMRFGCAASDDFIERYVAGIARPDVIYGAFDTALVLRGAAHIAFAQETAELGLSVEEGIRGQGIGTALLDGALDIARARGARRFVSQCLTHNRWMVSRVRRLGFDVGVTGTDTTAVAELPRPTPALLGRLAIGESLAWFTFNWTAIAAFAGLADAIGRRAYRPEPG